MLNRYNGTIFVTFIDDTAPSITYEGEWTQLPSTTAFENTLHLTTQASAQVTVSFQGSSIVRPVQMGLAGY